jgi:hypothetical protein
VYWNSDEVKLTTKQALQKIIKGILHTEEEDKYKHENTRKIDHTTWITNKWRVENNQILPKGNNHYIPFNIKNWRLWSRFSSQKTGGLD